MSSEEKRQILESVKQEIKADEGRDNEARLSYFVIGIFAGVLIAIVFMMAWQKSKEVKLSAQNQTLADLDKNLKTLENEHSQSIGLLKQLDIFSLVLAGRYKQSSILDDLRKNQYKKSKWTNLSFSKSSIVVGAQADNFEDVAKSVAAFKNMKAVKDVTLTAASINSDTKKVEFEMTLMVDLDLYKIKSAKTTSPNI